MRRVVCLFFQPLYYPSFALLCSRLTSSIMFPLFMVFAQASASFLPRFNMTSPPPEPVSEDESSSMSSSIKVKRFEIAELRAWECLAVVKDSMRGQVRMS